MNGRYAVVDDNGKTCVVYRTRDDTLDREYVVSSSFHDFRNLYLHECVVFTANGKRSRDTKAEIWLSHPDRRTYKGGLRFLPGVTECPEDVYNLWAGWSVEPRAGDWSLTKAHIKDVLCSGNQHRFEYLINWLARAVQQPGAQGEVAVVLRGARGTGKGAFARAFGAVGEIVEETAQFGPAFDRCLASGKAAVIEVRADDPQDRGVAALDPRRHGGAGGDRLEARRLEYLA